MKCSNTEGIKIKKNLTDRELEVLQYVVAGKTNKEIAQILTITHHTVKSSCSFNNKKNRS